MNFTKEALAEILQRFVEENGYNLKQAADAIGVPESSFRHWLHKKRMPAKHEHIAKLKHCFPEMGCESAGVVKIGLPAEKPPVSAASLLTADTRTTTGMMHEILLGKEIAGITPLLAWYVQEATPAERHSLRKKLGGNWERFSTLVRALVSEAALDISVQEGIIKNTQTEVK